MFPEAYQPTTYITAFLGVVTDNIGVILGIFAFVVAISFVLALLDSSYTVTGHPSGKKYKIKRY